MQKADSAWIEAKSIIEQKGKAIVLQKDVVFETLAANVCFDMQYPLVTIDPNIKWNEASKTVLSTNPGFEKQIKRVVTELGSFGVSGITAVKKIDIDNQLAYFWALRGEYIHLSISYWGLGLNHLGLEMFKAVTLTLDIATALKEPVELGHCYLNIGSFISEEKLLTASTLLEPANYIKWNVWKWPAIKEKLKKIAEMDEKEAAQMTLILSGGSLQ